MGQELLARGMKPNGTLWSANALLNEEYHKLLLDTHLDFINAGAEVIVTTTFTTRKIRLKDNQVEEQKNNEEFEQSENVEKEVKKKEKNIPKKTNKKLLLKQFTPPDDSDIKYSEKMVSIKE